MGAPKPPLRIGFEEQHPQLSPLRGFEHFRNSNWKIIHLDVLRGGKVCPLGFYYP